MARCAKCHGLFDNISGGGVTRIVGALCKDCAPVRRPKLYSMLNERTVKDRVRDYEQQLRKEAEARKQCLGLEAAEADRVGEMRKAAEDGDGKTYYEQTESLKISHTLVRLEEPRAFEVSRNFWDHVRAQLRIDSDDEETGVQ
ncbi:MAG: hypothetical protein M1812_007607 [Candelaria pacifica]|nr:MAG: hypothetical protein M1812_007607 [Candelaria pacifica]